MAPLCSLVGNKAHDNDKRHNQGDDRTPFGHAGEKLKGFFVLASVHVPRSFLATDKFRGFLYRAGE